jgi:hypothetical protein
MKAIKVDVVNRKVVEIEVDGSLKAIYEAIGCSNFEMPCVLENGDAVYCDGEALFSNPQNFVEIGEYSDPIAGNLLILGTNDDGESVDCSSSVEEIENDVIFLDVAGVLSRLRA